MSICISYGIVSAAYDATSTENRQPMKLQQQQQCRTVCAMHRKSRQSNKIVHVGILLRHCNHPFRYACESSRAPWALWMCLKHQRQQEQQPKCSFASQKQFPISHP